MVTTETRLKTWNFKHATWKFKRNWRGNISSKTWRLFKCFRSIDHDCRGHGTMLHLHRRSHQHYCWTSVDNFVAILNPALKCLCFNCVQRDKTCIVGCRQHQTHRPLTSLVLLPPTRGSSSRFEHDAPHPPSLPLIRASARGPPRSRRRRRRPCCCCCCFDRRNALIAAVVACGNIQTSIRRKPANAHLSIWLPTLFGCDKLHDQALTRLRHLRCSWWHRCFCWQVKTAYRRRRRRRPRWDLSVSVRRPPASSTRRIDCAARRRRAALRLQFASASTSM